jgi:hypothetical protein
MQKSTEAGGKLSEALIGNIVFYTSNGVTTQKTVAFTVTAVRTSTPTILLKYEGESVNRSQMEVKQL